MPATSFPTKCGWAPPRFHTLNPTVFSRAWFEWVLKRQLARLGVEMLITTVVLCRHLIPMCTPRSGCAQPHNQPHRYWKSTSRSPGSKSHDEETAWHSFGCLWDMFPWLCHYITLDSCPSAFLCFSRGFCWRIAGFFHISSDWHFRQDYSLCVCVCGVCGRGAQGAILCIVGCLAAPSNSLPTGFQ